MSHRCPWCLEPLGLTERRSETCPHCERPLDGPEGEPSELDLRYQAIETRQWTRALEVLQWGVPTIAVLAVVASFINVGGVFLAPLVALAHMVVLRVFLIRDARRYLGPSRRLFNRWTTRFAFLWLGLPGYAAMAVPLVGIVTGVATFVVLTGVVHVYTEWSLRQERLRQPLLVWEKVLMGGLAVATLMAVIVVVIGGVLVGWSVTTLIDWLSSE